MNKKVILRRHVSMPGLLTTAHKVFEKIPDTVNHRRFKLTDCLMSGLAVFHLKCPSLLHFDQQVRGPDANKAIVDNLQNLFKVEHVPSDTCLRERLDKIDPAYFRKAFRAIFRNLQRAKMLKHFTIFDDYYLLSLDGTGFYQSNKVHCSSCCEKHYSNGTISYYHQMMAGALVRPGCNIVIPFAPEMITKQDGSEKNDCERNASKRFIEKFRQDHPHLRTIVVEDALASNGPHIKHLQDHDLRFILGVKPGDHTLLFDWFGNHPDINTHTKIERTKKGVIRHQFRWCEKMPLNEANFDLEVNFLHYTEIGTDGKERTWSWVTDLPLEKERMMPMMRAGRARWKIENEAIQSLKKTDFGYQLEHNFGHGKQHLASVMANLCVLMFKMDQIAELCCKGFQRALKKQKRKKYLWERIRMLFTVFHIETWENLYRLLVEPHRKMTIKDVLLDEP